MSQPEYIAVLVVLSGSEAVDLHVGAHELPVHVAGDVGLEEVLVEQAVELLGLGIATARDLDLAEQPAPGALGAAPTALKFQPGFSVCQLSLALAALT